jgi:pimeloyl-ACP methyl ester carboxylesterase
MIQRTALTRAEVVAALRGEPHDHLEVGHARLPYWRFGRGPDVVLVHGWPLHAATFRGLIPPLADALTLHVFDLPGAGRSEIAPGAPLDLRSQAGTVRRAVDALGLGSYALLGHDSGGSIARLVAADDDRVRGLVVADSELPGHRSFALRALMLLSRVEPAGRALFAALRSRAVRRALFGACFDDPAWVEGEFTDLFLRPLFTSRAAAAGQLSMLRELDLSVVDGLREVHARLRMPVLCVWGARDSFFPGARARAMLPQFAGGAELVEVARGRIFTHEDHADEVAQAVRPFLLRSLGPVTLTPRAERPRSGVA